MKKQLYPDYSNFPSLLWRNPAKGLSVTQALTSISYVQNVQKRLYTVLHQGDMVDWKADIIKRRQLRSCISSQWIVAESNTIFLPLAI